MNERRRSSGPRGDTPSVRIEDGPVSADPAVNPLEEVERALSLLDGRHQDTVRVQRETQRAIAAKREAAEEESRRAASAYRRAVVLRVFGVLLVLGIVGTGALYGNLYYRRLRAADRALASAVTPYLAAGWQRLPRLMWRPKSRQEAAFAAATCVLAVATGGEPSGSPGNGKLVVERRGDASVVGFSATGSAAWCTCGDERTLVHTDGDVNGGVELLSQPARNIGGTFALPFLSPHPATLPPVDACPIDPLDTWLASGHGVSPPNDADIASLTREALKGRGFALVASAPESIPFAVVPAAADSCFVAASTTPGEELSLRLALGLRPLRIAPGSSLAIGWCTHLPIGATVFRAGKGAVAVYRADSPRLPGTLGLREAAARAGLGDVPTWVSPGELGWDASSLLLVSGVSSADIRVPTDARPVPRARVIALTLENARVTAEPDEIDRYTCLPSLDAHPRGALCVQSMALGWRALTGEPAGIAQSPLPFWMDVMTNVEDSHGLTAELQLLTLSRRLAREGYEATARNGVFEEPTGVEVVGRPDDDRAIAVGLTSLAPWVLPYTEGAPWTIDAEPHSFDLLEGQHVHLTTYPSSRVPADARRTVVFRHRLGVR